MAKWVNADKIIPQLMEMAKESDPHARSVNGNEFLERVGRRDAIQEVINILKAEPLISDVRRVVRCQYCESYDTCEYGSILHGNGYCSRGKRHE